MSSPYREGLTGKQYLLTFVLTLALACGVAYFVCRINTPPIDNRIVNAADSIKTATHTVHDNTKNYTDSLQRLVSSLQNQISKTNHNTHESIQNIFLITDTDSLESILSAAYDTLAQTRFREYVTEANRLSGIKNNVRTR